MNCLATSNRFRGSFEPKIQSAIERNRGYPDRDSMLIAYEMFMHERTLLDALSLVDEYGHRYSQSYCNLIGDNLHMYLDRISNKGLYLVVYHLKYMDNCSEKSPIL